MNRSEAGQLGYQKIKDKLEKWKNSMREAAIQKHLVNPNNRCKCCGKIRPYEKRDNFYCSKECWTKSKMVEVKKLHGIIVECLNCNTETNNSKFCSRKCAQEFKSKELIKKWLAGESFPQMKFPKPLKKYLIQIKGNKCEKCDWCEAHPITGKVPIQLNHIDGNSSNNSYENLELLCPNCHSLTPNFGALNKGYGRTYRYKKSHISTKNNVSENLK
jgi:hypothetical protein